MKQLKSKILISELHDGFIEKLLLWAHAFLGYQVLIFDKKAKQIQSTNYHYLDYSTLKNYDFKILFHRKGEWSELLFDEVFSQKEFFSNDKEESKKFRILIKDLIQRSLRDFDELLYFAELKKDEFDQVKIRCSWNIVRSQILKKSIATNNISISFSYLTAILNGLKKIFKLSLARKIIGFFILKSIKKTKNKYNANSSEVIYFPHKGLTYGDSFEKNYYYSENKLSPLYQKNILHLEYVSYDPIIAKSYEDKNLDYSFIERPQAKDLIKYIFLNSNFKIFESIKKTLDQKLSGMLILLYLYLNTVSKFLVDFYLERFSLMPGCKFALLGYDVLFPKELSVAFHKLNITTIAIQERYALVYAGNYNVVADKYFVWSYSTEQMMDESIGESYVGDFIVTGPPRADKIIKYNNQLLRNSRKKFVVYCNSPEPSYVNKFTVLNNWVIINALLQDILAIANNFSDCDFVIRAKHTGWDKINYFDNILALLDKKKNVYISSDYDKMDVSYELLKGAYGILGHHTSIADEGMFCGFPVLFHDFGPYSQSIYAENYNYNLLDIFSKSSEDFQSKFFNYFIKDNYPGEFESHLERTYRNLSKSSVLKKISKNLESLVEGP